MYVFCVYVGRASLYVQRYVGTDFADLISTSEARFRTSGVTEHLTYMDLSANELNGTIPSSLCSLPSLNSTIIIDCGEITCDCCSCA